MDALGTLIVDLFWLVVGFWVVIGIGTIFSERKITRSNRANAGKTYNVKAIEDTREVFGKGDRY